LDKNRRILVGILNHEMDVQNRAGGLPQRLDNGWADGDIGHEVAVHDIHMEHAAARGFECGDLLPQAREIRRENRWKNLNHEMFELMISRMRKRHTPKRA